MELVYEATRKAVRVGDCVGLRDGRHFMVDSFRKPHKASSEGHVSLKTVGGRSIEFYVGVIGAKWINREDRA